MKIDVPAEKLAAAINKYLIPALVRSEKEKIRRSIEESEEQKKSRNTHKG